MHLCLGFWGYFAGILDIILLVGESDTIGQVAISELK